MAKYTKPNYSEQWASAGSIVAPNSVKIQAGHIVEKPNYEYMNWIQNRQDVGIAYGLQMGIPEWDSTTQYQYTLNSYASYIQRNGVVYKAIQTGTNKDPLTETAYWSIAFDDKGGAAAVQSNLSTHITNYGTLTGLTNTATARTNLDVYSKAEAAQKNGDATKLFSVANGTTGNEAVNKSQLDTKANKNGNSSETFSVATATTAAHAVRKDQFDAFVNPFTGFIFPFSGTSVPTGFLLCDGSAVSRTTYATLFAVIGTVWGVGNGSTTFNLPDGRGKSFLGADAGKGDDTSLTVGTYVAQQGGVETINTFTGGSPALAPATITVPQDGTASALFATGDGVSGTDQSMSVANTEFVYPRSFVGQWMIKT